VGSTAFVSEPVLRITVLRVRSLGAFSLVEVTEVTATLVLSRLLQGSQAVIPFVVSVASAHVYMRG
jgi:hypothetical protein